MKSSWIIKSLAIDINSKLVFEQIVSLINEAFTTKINFVYVKRE